MSQIKHKLNAFSQEMKAERCAIAPERSEELLTNLSFYVLVQGVSYWF